MPSVERWYVLSSVVRRYISFIVSGTSMNYLLLYHQWYGGIYLFMPSVERGYVLSSVVRRYISFIVSGTSMNYLLLYHQWYGGIYLFHTFSGTLVCVIVSGTAVYLFSISSVVRWYISFIPSVERWYVLSSVVRRYISFIVSGTSMNYISLYHQWYGGIYLFHTFSGTWVCVIVSGTAVHLFHRQWYVDELSPLYHQWYGGISP